MPRVLIIDDDQTVANLLRSQLTDEGYQVSVAYDGGDGVVQATTSRPDLILLDVFLPDATGFQICSQFRKSEGTRSTPIIMMTGAARYPNQQLYGYQKGANEYIFKPFNIEEVDRLIHKYLDSNDQPPP
jgi:DNA-binding response OmpR family regulator